MQKWFSDFSVGIFWSFNSMSLNLVVRADTNSGNTILFAFEYSTLAYQFYALAEKLLGLSQLDIYACKAWFSNKLETSRKVSISGKV